MPSIANWGNSREPAAEVSEWKKYYARNSRPLESVSIDATTAVATVATGRGKHFPTTVEYPDADTIGTETLQRRNLQLHVSGATFAVQVAPHKASRPLFGQNIAPYIRLHVSLRGLFMRPLIQRLSRIFRGEIYYLRKPYQSSFSGLRKCGVPCLYFQIICFSSFG